KVAVAAVSSLLLVAMVVALMYNGRGDDAGGGGVDVAASQKAMVTIDTLCSSTDYKKACVDTLRDSGNSTSDPKELMEIAFRATMDRIAAAGRNSSVLREVQRDPRGREAVDACAELAERAVADLNRTFEKFSKEFSEFDLTNADEVVGDLKIWLSGAVTYQETCLDGFEGVSGDAGDRMRDLLTLSMQMSSNALAMMTGMQSILSSFSSSSSSAAALGSRRRRLLSEKDDLPKLNIMKPDLIVAKDGSGDFKTINEALFKVPENSEKTFVLYIKEGIYEEQVKINSSFTNLLVVGDGPLKTRITGKLNFVNGTTTYQSATVAVHGDRFTAMDVGFENAAGPEGHQAVALRVSADLAVFYNCHMDGYQDTLYAHTYRQFYRDCTISGTIDYIFGDAAALFQGCTMVVRKPLANQYCIVTAQGRKDVHQPTGLVLQNCSVVGDPAYYPVMDVNKAYLARPWKLYSRAVIMESYIDRIIQPDGYLEWNGTFALDTLFYTEFNNRGPGADKSRRLKWTGIKELTGKRMKRFTGDDFIDGSRWTKHNKMKIPYKGGFV
ncbi:pectinesterase, partial [Genlisea aurea]